jgi:hypothetical protein
MSRQHNLTEPHYGQIKLKCPYKHKVGVILVQPRRPVGRQSFHRLGDVLKEPEMIPVDPSEKDGELKLAEPEPPVDIEGVVERGRPVSAECQRCGQTWQTPWEMVEPAIAQLVNTPVVTLTLYDRPAVLT